MIRWMLGCLLSLVCLSTGGCTSGTATLITSEGSGPGWQRVSVSTADFSVEFPDRMVRFEIKSNVKTAVGEAKQIRVFQAVFGSHENIAVENVLADAGIAKDPKSLLQAARENLDPQSRHMIKEEELTVDGAPAADFEYEDDLKRHVFQRLVARDHKLYQVVVYFLDSVIDKEAHDTAKHILASFQFKS